jgi:very-short-patch-repair endonuclease
MTEAEKHLWWAVKDRRLQGYKFRRQHPVGPYVLDFACTECGVAIEIDGGQHVENARDVLRTAWLESEGWQVMRFWNNEILTNMPGVLETLLAALQRSPSPSLSLNEGEGNC